MSDLMVTLDIQIRGKDLEGSSRYQREELLSLKIELPEALARLAVTAAAEVLWVTPTATLDVLPAGTGISGGNPARNVGESSE